MSKTTPTSQKPKLFITPEVIEERNISQVFIESLKEWFDVHTVPDRLVLSQEELLQHVQGSFAILCSALQPMNEEIVKAAGPTLKVISQPAAGFNNIDQAAMKKHNVRVGVAGSAITSAAAEMAVTLLLSACRHVVKFVNEYKTDPLTNFQPKCPVVTGLQNSTVGIVGAGRVGTSIARKVAQFDISKLLYASTVDNPAMKTLGAQYTKLELLAKSCDYVVVALPHTKATDKIINKSVLDLMKPTAIFVNIGRGGTVDQDALVDALINNKIAGAALDVTTPEPLDANHPLLKLENALISPHVGGLTTVAAEKAIRLAMDNIFAILNDQPMPDELKLQ